jgi:hypothetical protein
MKQKKSSVLIFCLLFVGSFLSHKTISAQCKYVAIEKEKGKATTIAIPCDFPVQLETGNPGADRENFDRAVNDWKKQHPDFAQLNLKPALVSGNFIQIPNRELMIFPAEKREAIRKTAFYQITE